MGTNTQSDANSPDTDARIDVKTNNHRPAERRHEYTYTNFRRHCHRSVRTASESEEVDNALGGFVMDVSTIAQSRCERATDYADIETLVRLSVRD